MRVASLLPSITEYCYALDVDPVAVSHECDYPPPAAEVPSLDRVHADVSGSPADVDAAVTDDAGPVYSIDDETLRATDPDLVAVGATCDACAIGPPDVEAALDRTGVDAEVLPVDVTSLSDCYDAISLLGDRVGRKERAADVVAGLRERVETVADRAAGADATPRVVVLDWPDPPMVAGHWVPEMVELAGGEYGLADPGDRSTPREWDDIVEYDPEVLVVSPCGFGLDRTLAHCDAVTDRPGYDDLAAVRAGRAYAVDGHHYVNRPGPRLVDTLEFVAGLVQPERFQAPPDDVAVRVDAARHAGDGAGGNAGDTGAAADSSTG